MLLIVSFKMCYNEVMKFLIASYYRQLSADVKMKSFDIKTSIVSPDGAEGPG